MSKRTAEDKLAALIGREFAQPSPSGHNPTFADVWEGFSGLKAGVWGKATAGILKSIFGKHVLPAIGDREVAQLTPDPLQRLLNRLAERGYQQIHPPSTSARTSRAALEYAVDEGLVSRNPARKLELPRTERSRQRFYTLPEIDHLLSAATGRENLVLRILLFCGLRPAELLALRIEDVFCEASCASMRR